MTFGAVRAVAWTAISLALVSCAMPWWDGRWPLFNNFHAVVKAGPFETATPASIALGVSLLVGAAGFFPAAMGSPGASRSLVAPAAGVGAAGLVLPPALAWLVLPTGGIPFWGTNEHGTGAPSLGWFVGLAAAAAGLATVALARRQPASPQ